MQTTWVAEWEARLLTAWAMAGHERLGAAAGPRDLGDDLLRRIGELAALDCGERRPAGRARAVGAR